MRERAYFVLTLAALAAGSSACGGQATGEAIEFEAAARGVSSTPSGPRVFRTDTGWSVELEAARIIVGPIHLTGDGRRADRSRSRFPFSGPSVAYAGPGDPTGFEPQPALGDVLDQYVVDLLHPEPTSLGRVFGLKGHLAAVEVQLHPPGHSTPGSSGADLSSMRGHSFVLEGVATRDDRSVRFAAAGHLGNLDAERTVTRIDASLPLADREEQPGQLILDIHVDEWLRQIDFGSLTERDAEGRYQLPADSPPGATLRQGIRSRLAYSLSWSTHP